MKTATFFMPCGDCIFWVDGECAEGRGNTEESDGCEQLYYYDCPMAEIPDEKPPKKFIKSGKKC